MNNSKAIVVFSISLVIMFIAAQFLMKPTINGGVCSPYLGAPDALQHPAYKFTNYGFPIPFVTVSTDICSEAELTTYQWSVIGVFVEIFLLTLIAYPIWSPFLKKANQKQPPQ